MKKILITGPESSGKTTLAKQLAHHFDSPWVAEYAREFLDNLDRPYREEDLDKILSGQLAKEQEATHGLHPFLFCDTGPEVLYIWSQVKYDRVSPNIKQVTKEQNYDLRIICYPDLEWIEDEWREAPDIKQRLSLFKSYCQLHEQYNWPYFIAKGAGSHRFLQTLEYLNSGFIGNK